MVFDGRFSSEVGEIYLEHGLSLLRPRVRVVSAIFPVQGRTCAVEAA